MNQSLSQTEAYQNFEQICDQVIATRQPIEIVREGSQSVSLIATSELNSLMETVYLFSSHENATRLLDALERAKTCTNHPRTIEDIRQEFGLYEEGKKVSA